MNKTNIEYLQYTWNPIAMLCTPLSPGCKNCWHRAIAKSRLANNPTLPPAVRQAYAGASKPLLLNDRLRQPAARKKPTLIGVQYMGDIFHPTIPHTFRDDIFITMASTPQHWYIVLSKYSRQMQDYLSLTWPQPLDNVIGMTSVESQDYAYRIDRLLAAPLRLRGVSIGPLLGPIDIAHYTSALDWVIVEDESGPARRPAELDWVRCIRDACINTHTPFFFKQWHGTGKRESIPALDGCQWAQYPTALHNIVASS